MPKEKYTPSSEEVQKAEGMMTPEQKKATEEREEFFIQERDAFDDEAWIGQKEERHNLSDIERETMNSDLKKLGQIFRGSDIKWQLDGAQNISLMKIAEGGDYIGVHKDTDISIEPDELEAVDMQLAKNGYGLFLSYLKNPEDPKSKRLMKRVGAAGFRGAAGQEHYMIVAIDEKGKILKGEHLNFIDTHLIQRGPEGKPLGYGEVFLPEEWLEPRPMEFQGEIINLSHPARVAYYKLHMKRKYDTKDLEELARTGQLSVADMDAIEKVMQEELENYKKRGADFLRPVWEKIKEDMNADEIFKLFAEDPKLSEAAKTPEGTKKFKDLSKQFADKKNISFEEALEIAVKMSYDFQGRDERIYGLRKKVEETEEKNKLRKNI